jgi:hypothetical protein
LVFLDILLAGGGGVWCGGIIPLFLPLLMNRLIDRSIDQLSEYWYYYFDCGGWACFFREEALLFPTHLGGISCYLI